MCVCVWLQAIIAAPFILHLRNFGIIKEIDDAISRLRMMDIVEVPNKGREGQGLTKTQYYQSCTKREQRKMVI